MEIYFCFIVIHFIHKLIKSVFQAWHLLFSTFISGHDGQVIHYLLCQNGMYYLSGSFTVNQLVRTLFLPLTSAS